MWTATLNPSITTRPSSEETTMTWGSSMMPESAVSVSLAETMATFSLPSANETRSARVEEPATMSARTKPAVLGARSVAFSKGSKRASICASMVSSSGGNSSAPSGDRDKGPRSSPSDAISVPMLGVAAAVLSSPESGGGVIGSAGGSGGAVGTSSGTPSGSCSGALGSSIASASSLAGASAFGASELAFDIITMMWVRRSVTVSARSPTCARRTSCRLPLTKSASSSASSGRRPVGSRSSASNRTSAAVLGSMKPSRVSRTR